MVATAKTHNCGLDLLLKRSEHLAVGAHNFKEVVVLLLGHNGGARDKLIWQGEKGAFLLSEHHHVSGETRCDHHRNVQSLEHNHLEVATGEAAIENVFLTALKFHQLSGLLAIEYEVVDAEARSRPERILVHKRECALQNSI